MNTQRVEGHTPTEKELNRFFGKVRKTAGCWLWEGAISSTGYGRTRFRSKQWAAHRLSWVLHEGPIASGYQVCHKCDVANCINPEHLFLGTQLDNVRDMLAKGRNRPWGREVTHCPQGHEYTPENTYTTKQRIRHCKTCGRDRARKYQRDKAMLRLAKEPA